MMKALAIADDLSGAAEIAGIGHRFGLPTQLVRRAPATFAPGLTVIDTDTRSVPSDEAARTVSQFIVHARSVCFDLVYKKTDSVLRGPVAAELDALAAALNRTSCLLVPQNPSRGRVIVGGEYRIDGVPLHETSFADDPMHPARTSRAADLLGLHERAITIGDGTCAADLRRSASQLTHATLPAGGADFFTAILEEEALVSTRSFLNALPDGPRLFVCGSAMPYPFLPHVADRPMIDATDGWCDAICALLSAGHHARMTIDRPLDRTPGVAARIERTVANVAATALRRCAPRIALVTGGATASAICREMSWDQFDVEGELATGVVQLRPRGAGATSLIVKPGSYPWPPQVEPRDNLSLGSLRRG